jgi:hypothetical protein
VVEVFHGPWVEIRQDRFFEGAWDGDFQRGDFALSSTHLGSGGQVVDGQPLFSAPTDMFSGIYSLRTEQHLLVSNSGVFVMSMAGDKPDIEHPDYDFDMVHRRRWGLREQSIPMPTHLGNRLNFHTWDSYVVDMDLNLARFARVHPPAPKDFLDYSGLLHETTQRVLQNGSDKARIRTYRAVTSLSQGYDCNASAAVAAKHGCTEAMTFRVRREPGCPDDSGREVAHHLGLTVTEYENQGFQQLSGCVEAEFSASWAIPCLAPLAVAEEQLEGSLFITGRFGDNVWGTDLSLIYPDLLSPKSHHSAGLGFTEMRLRVGFLHFPIPYIGAVHAKDIHGIAESPEMEFWNVPGHYNRPIARRLLEDSGVPREAFGQVKMAGAYTKNLTSETQKDFDAYYDTQPIPDWFRRPIKLRWQDLPDALLATLHAITALEWLNGDHWRVYKLFLPITLRTTRKFRRAFPWVKAINGLSWKHLYMFHWGFQKVEHRYRIDRP